MPNIQPVNPRGSLAKVKIKVEALTVLEHGGEPWQFPEGGVRETADKVEKDPQDSLEQFPR